MMTPTLTSMVLGTLRAGSDRPAVIHPDRTLTFADLARESADLAAGLHGLGVRCGDRVALAMANRWEFAVCDLAILRLGAVKVPLNEMLPSGDIAYMLDHSDAAAVIVGPRMAERVATALTSLEQRPQIVALDGEGREQLAGMAVATFDDVVGDPTVLESIEVRPDDPAAIFYTGGTTGRPKGVLHTQASLAANQTAQIAEAEIRSSDRLLLMTPLPHAAGLFLQAAIVRGATTHILPSFDPGVALDYARDHAITWTFLVPTMIYRLLDVAAERGVDLPSLTTIVYGAAPISPSRLRQGLEAWGQVFVQLYGQTECPNWGTRLAKEDHDISSQDTRLGSCGRASLLADVAVVDKEGTAQAPGTTGEVVLRSPYLLQGYWKDSDATRKKFLDGGWIRTGDIGLMDADGYLYLKDRRADMIITGGMNVYTSDVETAISRLQGVRQVAVVGVPHPDWGESVHAVIVADGTLDQDRVLDHCRGELARYAVPKTVDFVDELPVTAYGKIDKKRLRAAHWAGHDRLIN